MNHIDYTVIALYLGGSIMLGCRLSGRQTNTEQYFLSGRNMKWLPVAIALFAALFSSISYIAMPGEAYNYGCTMLVSSLPAIIALPVMLFVFLRPLITSASRGKLTKANSPGFPLFPETMATTREVGRCTIPPTDVRGSKRSCTLAEF